MTLAFAGLTAIEVSVGGVTMRIVEPVTDPETAVIIVCPGAIVAPRPVLLMPAMVTSEDAHITADVRSCVV